MTDFLLKKRPNIVLIMCDQMRGDCLGIAGHPDVKTPYLDSLAAEGTYFPKHTVPVLAAFPPELRCLPVFPKNTITELVIRMVLPGITRICFLLPCPMEAITRKWLAKCMCIHHYIAVVFKT